MNFQILKTFELRPLPHGTQRSGVLALVRELKWQAKPLQPSRGDAAGMGWTVGAAEDPPTLVAQTKFGDVTITLLKEATTSKKPPTLFTSRRTQQHLRKGASTASSSASGLSSQGGRLGEVPWQNYDPWQKQKPLVPPLTDADVKMKDPPVAPIKKIAEVEGRLKDDILKEIRRDSESRLNRLEVDMNEIKTQNGKFETWFTEAAEANRQVQEQVQQLREEVTVQKHDSAALASEIRGGFAAMQQMFQNPQDNKTEQDPAKRFRAEWWFVPGPCLPRSRVPGPTSFGCFKLFFWLMWTTSLQTTLATSTTPEWSFGACTHFNVSSGDIVPGLFQHGGLGVWDCGVFCTILLLLFTGIFVHFGWTQYFLHQMTWRLDPLCPRRLPGVLHRPRCRLAYRRRRLRRPQAPRLCILWLLATTMTHFLPVAYAATDPCGVHFNDPPSVTLNQLINSFADPSQDVDEATHELNLLFMSGNPTLQEEPEDWITMHSYLAMPYRGEHRSAAVSPWDQVQHQQTLRALLPLTFRRLRKAQSSIFRRPRRQIAPLAAKSPPSTPFRHSRLLGWFWSQMFWNLFGFDGEMAALDWEMAALDREMAALDREMAALDREMAAIDREMAAIDREMAGNGGLWPGNGTTPWWNTTFDGETPLSTAKRRPRRGKSTHDAERACSPTTTPPNKDIGRSGYAMVLPPPVPRQQDQPTDVHYILWRPPLFNLAAVLVDFATDVQILDRHAVTLPTPVNHVTIFRHFGLLNYCFSDESCSIYFGYQLWPNLQPPVRPLPPGQYLQIQIAHQFADADAFWREVRRRPRPPSRSRTPPLRPHAGERIGEASNPGPSYWLGTVNPTGLRNKEMHLATLPQGVWGIQESHLSGVTQRPCTLALQRAFKDTGRSIFCVPGAPVALRARSSETGIWAGVLFASSLIAKPLTWHWPHDEFALGRVQAAQFWVGPFSMTGVNLYGWATWPQAIQATNDLLETITKELIMSRTGPRFVVGDFNLREEHAPLLAMWRDLGWTEVQDWAYIKHSRAYTPTCKKSTFPDKIFISPELLPFIRSVRTWELFPDHDVLGARLELPALAVPHTIWPLPAEVPWSHVDREQWQQSTPKVAASLSITDHFLQFCDSYEHSFDGCISTPEHKLPSNCRGRGTVTAPKLRPAQCPSLKASRPGELQPGAFQLGRAVMAWFKQLRRFQSMVHSLRSSNTSANAQLYRAQLWHAIKDGRGFQQGFVKWWPTRNIRLQGLPPVLPHGVPHRVQAELLFLDFQHNYRQFESWHARRRRELLTASFQTSRAKTFKVIQPGPPAPLSFLEKTDMCAILSVDSTGALVTVDNPLPQGEDVSYDIDGVTVDATSVSPASFHLEGDCLFWPGQKIRATTSLTTQAGIQTELQRFWEPRWCRSPPSSTDWTRIMNFARAHLPPGSMNYTEITSDHWRASLKRYAPHAARGPDGFTRLDLVQMPPAFVDNLMQQITRWESQRAWPAPLLAGFVHPLAKRETSIGAGDFRPIVIYPLIYRTWGSIRAKQLLRHLRGWTTQHQFGFMPGVEAAELFYVTQALIEVSVLENAGHCGLITDLQKAFECLPREPVWQVAEWVGIPLEILHLWAAYLETMKRHFRVDGQFGPGLPSTSGYPEGCALSCAAMGLVNVCFHAYMLAFAPNVTALSYVDNLELVVRDGFSLLQAQIALLSWTELWTLQLDDEKTFVWGTTPELRQECEGLRRPVLRTAKDLGAQITYGKGHFVAEQVKRLESLKPLWSMLHRSGVALHHKQMLLQQALWPRAFFGIAVCRLGFAHIRSLRTAAVRALHFGKAGAHPGLRLFLLSPVLCDPGSWGTIRSPFSEPYRPRPRKSKK